MPDAIDQYLNEVLGTASLTRGDAQRVRAELRDHLEELAAPHKDSSTQEEIRAMLNKEFGKPESIGKAIAAAKGRFRTYLKKKLRRLPITLTVCLLLAFAVSATVAEAFYASSDAVAPNIPKGSRMLVYKLARVFQAGDIVVFRNDQGEARLGIVQAVHTDKDTLQLWRNGKLDREIPRSKVVGRVILNTR